MRVALGALVAAMAMTMFTATASAHCASPNGWVHLHDDGGAAWVQAWASSGGQAGWVQSNTSVYGSTYNADWAFAWANTWFWNGNAWMQRTGWDWVSTHVLHC